MDSIFRLAGELLRFKFTNIKWLKVCKNILSPFVFFKRCTLFPGGMTLDVLLIESAYKLALNIPPSVQGIYQFLMRAFDIIYRLTSTME